MENAKELLRLLAGRLLHVTGAVALATSAALALCGTFHAEWPLGIGLGAALGLGRMWMTGRLFPLIMAARRGKTAIAVTNQLAGIALVAAFLAASIRVNVWLFAGSAAGLSLIPVVIIANRKRISARISAHTSAGAHTST